MLVLSELSLVNIVYQVMVQSQEKRNQSELITYQISDLDSCTSINTDTISSNFPTPK